MSPNASLRADYAKYLYIGLLAATLLHAAAFAFWPEYVPSVYKLRIEILPLIDVIPEYEVPPLPREIEPPVDLAEMIESDDADPGETIGPNFVNLKDLPVIKPPSIDGPPAFFGFDREPKLIRAVKPVYPEIARKAEVEGSVAVLVTIDESGGVIRAIIAHSDAAVFDQPALDAAFKHVFRPAEQNGIPVKATIGLTFRFVLRD
jgi:TonB family protein